MSGEPAVGSESSAGADLQQPLHQEAGGGEAGGGAPEAQSADGAATDTDHEPGPSGTHSSSSDAGGSDPAERAARLEAELAALRAEHENLNSQYMRLAADFDNFRKRQSRDQDDQRLQITCS
ncbi:MAG: nucleotide exchange factor GrpE, partial [Prochlorococcaceae cyanobacterium]